jgi:hypothetical protein
MSNVRWEHIDTLSGAGRLTHSQTKESLPVHYYLEVWQEVLEPLRGHRIYRQKDLKGRIEPMPSWPFDTHMVILQLEDGQRLKFWLKNQRGEIVGSGVPAEEL